MEELLKSHERYLAALAAGYKLSEIAQHSIGWVNTPEGQKADEAQTFLRCMLRRRHV